MTGTWSVCPVCLKRVPADRRVEGADLYLHKECPEHGTFRTVVRRGDPGIWEVPAPSEVDASCPAACGNCPHDAYG